MARILVVDDDPIVRDALAALLTHDGHSVATADDGQDALRLLDRETVDLVITDIVMPRVDGLELVTEVRRMKAPPAVIVISDGGRRGSTVYLDLAMQLGADAALSKPLVLGELREHIDRLTGAA